MVADKVELITRKAGTSEAVIWRSTGKEKFEIEETAKEDQGTTITIFLKEDASLYLESWKVTEIIHRYSDFIEYPIVLPQVHKAEDGTETVEERILNSQKAIWLRSASEIAEEEYQSFFSHLSHGGKLLKPIHMSAEGTSEFKALLFIPEVPIINKFFGTVITPSLTV